jgi:hypothetical protein
MCRGEGQLGMRQAQLQVVIDRDSHCDPLGTCRPLDHFQIYSSILQGNPVSFNDL